jgi:HEPN domain-containing protein
MRHAAEDARIARGCLGFDPPALGGAANHCQQAVEKLLKGFLVLGGVDFRKTHDLDALADIVLTHFPSVEAGQMIKRSWTAWGIAYRYPAEDESEPEPTLEELSEAFDLIEHLEIALRSLAP